MTTPANHRPTYKLYSVCKLRDGKSSWTDIGVGWPHKDGNGFTIKSTAVPVPGAAIMLRRDIPQNAHPV
jgi:hypothetical protein